MTNMDTTHCPKLPSRSDQQKQPVCATDLNAYSPEQNLEALSLHRLEG